MRRSLVLLFVGIAVGGLAFGLGAQAVQNTVSSILGLHFSHYTSESYEMTVGITLSGQPKRSVRFEDIREQFHYPAFYGSLKSVVQDGDRTVLWFQDSGGVVRNAVVTEGSTSMLRIEPQVAKKIIEEPVRDRR